jgi:hypothetical protein
MAFQGWDVVSLKQAVCQPVVPESTVSEVLWHSSKTMTQHYIMV